MRDQPLRWLRVLLLVSWCLTACSSAQDAPRDEEKAKAGLQTWALLQWTYPQATSMPHIGFVIESCVQDGPTCPMVARWSVPPLTFQQGVARPMTPGETKCFQVRALGPKGVSDPTNVVCLSKVS